jgi:hypothetical protein
LPVPGSPYRMTPLGGLMPVSRGLHTPTSQLNLAVEAILDIEPFCVQFVTSYDPHLLQVPNVSHKKCVR